MKTPTLQDFQKDKEELRCSILKLIHVFENKYPTAYVEGLSLSHTQVLGGDATMTSSISVSVKI
ncbi:MAG: hypothetical protein FJY17_00290 [Bacteroidetes bacterium]|nr:hypothetical protein [Bacteroidota bacterium]